MAGREVREYTNLTDPKDRKWGKGKDKIDDEDITFQRMVAKTISNYFEKETSFANELHTLWNGFQVQRVFSQMQEVAGERGGYLHGRGALDSDDLLYLKEQMEAEEDAERLLRRTEKRAFAAFKKAASLADSSPASVPLPLRVEPKPKSGIRQQDLLKKVVEVKPKRPRVSNHSLPTSSDHSSANSNSKVDQEKKECSLAEPGKTSVINEEKTDDSKSESENPIRSLLGAYASSDDED